MAISVILLAGGVGTRMQSKLPKQFLSLKNRPIAHYSLNVFLSMPEVVEIVVVCAPEYRSIFTHDKIIFALPGLRRQDSVFNGLEKISSQENLVCIHDSARPLIDLSLVQRVCRAAEEHGAAVCGVPIKHTIKEVDKLGFVQATPDRSRYWEIQTPQVIRAHLLRRGFDLARQTHLTVTDDAALVELLGKPVKLVEGSYLNIKITTSDDLHTAESLLNRSLGTTQHGTPLIQL